MKYFDTHCHLDFPDYDSDRDKVIEKSKNEGIEYIINVGVNVESSKKSIEIASRYKFIFVGVGIHPSDVYQCNKKDIFEIEKLSKEKKVVAIGEIGLDFYYNKDNREKQTEFFITQLKIASENLLPVIIHQRESKEEVIEILEKMNKNLPEKIVFHCFGEDNVFAKYCKEKNFYISFTGIITFKNANGIREIAKDFPLEKIMSETDSPYLSPTPFRGKRNEPSNVRYIVEEIANQKKQSIEEVSNVIFKNSITFFSIPSY